MKKMVLSKKRYAYARLGCYVVLVAIIAMFFAPIITVRQNDELSLISKISVSPFQILTDTATATVRLETEDGEKIDGFLGSIAQNTEVNVIEELYGDDEAAYIAYNVMRVMWLVIVLLVMLIWSFKQRKCNKKLLGQVQVNDYISSVYYALPNYLTMVELISFFSTITAGVLVHGAPSIQQGDYTFNPWGLFIGVIVCLSLTQVVPRVICFKDIRLIKQTGIMFDEPFDKHTLLSDIKDIGYLFGWKATSTAPVASEVQDNSIDTLYQYKKLLDDGIITEEEFQAQKEKILNNTEKK